MVYNNNFCADQETCTDPKFSNAFIFVDFDLELTFDLFALTLLKIQTLLLWASCVKFFFFLAGFVEFLASNAPALNLKDCLNLLPL